MSGCVIDCNYIIVNDWGIDCNHEIEWMKYVDGKYMVYDWNIGWTHRVCDWDMDWTHRVCGWDMDWTHRCVIEMWIEPHRMYGWDMDCGLNP